MKYLKAFAKILISVLALVFVFSKIDLESVWILIKKSNPVFILLGILAYAASQLLSTFRLNAFFKAIQVHISNWSNIKLYSIGMFYNLLLPGGIGGDAYKVYFLKKNNHSKVKTLVQALLLDRLVGLTAILILIVVFYAFLKEAIPFQKFSWLMVVLLLIGPYFLLKYFGKTFASIYTLTLLQSIFVQGLQILAVWFLLQALGLSTISLPWYLLFMMSSIAAAIPFTIGGAGARELVFLFGSEWFGIATELSVALSLLFYFSTVLVSLSGIYFIFRGNMEIDQVIPN